MYAGQLARITLTHPPLNVIDFQMMDELLAAMQQLEQRKEVSVVIISGAAAAFLPEWTWRCIRRIRSRRCCRNFTA